MDIRKQWTVNLSSFDGYTAATPRALVLFSASFIVADAVCDLEDLFP